LARRVTAEPWRLDAAETRMAAVRGLLDLYGIREALLHQGAVLLTRVQMDELRARSRKGDASLRSPFMVNQGAWTPFWRGGDLFLARQVWVGERELLQGVWLEWAAVKEVLMSAIRDLLPSAELAPAPEPLTGESGRRLSSLPVRLVPGTAALEVEGRRSGRLALIFGWASASRSADGWLGISAAI
jgi:hypothetical protein